LLFTLFGAQWGHKHQVCHLMPQERIAHVLWTMFVDARQRFSAAHNMMGNPLESKLGCIADLMKAGQMPSSIGTPLLMMLGESQAQANPLLNRPQPSQAEPSRRRQRGSSMEWSPSHPSLWCHATCLKQRPRLHDPEAWPMEQRCLAPTPGRPNVMLDQMPLQPHGQPSPALQRWHPRRRLDTRFQGSLGTRRAKCLMTHPESQHPFPACFQRVLTTIFSWRLNVPPFQPRRPPPSNWEASIQSTSLFEPMMCDEKRTRLPCLRAVPL
jgi:hypothetical protein